MSNKTHPWPSDHAASYLMIVKGDNTLNVNVLVLSVLLPSLGSLIRVVRLHRSLPIDLFGKFRCVNENLHSNPAQSINPSFEYTVMTSSIVGRLHKTTATSCFQTINTNYNHLLNHGIPPNHQRGQRLTLDNRKQDPRNRCLPNSRLQPSKTHLRPLKRFPRLHLRSNSLRRNKSLLLASQ